MGLVSVRVRSKTGDSVAAGCAVVRSSNVPLVVGRAAGKVGVINSDVAEAEGWGVVPSLQAERKTVSRMTNRSDLVLFIKDP